MKFYALRKGQAFRFADQEGGPILFSAGVDGAFGRYVEELEELSHSAFWHYCKPLDEVAPVSPLDELADQAQKLGLGY
jgi:hypothetical protein